MALKTISDQSTLKKKLSCNNCEDSNCFIKKHIAKEWHALIDKKKFQTTYNRGQNIINAGAPVLGLYFIIKGKVKVISIGFTGKPQIVRFSKDGHVLGHRGLGSDTYSISAIAMDDTQVCFIDNATLHNIFMNNPEFTYAMLLYYSDELRKVEERLKIIAQMTIREKIAYSLVLLYNNFGVNYLNMLDVHFTREDLASVAGTSNEQVVRQLTEFEEEVLIHKHGRKIIIDNINKLKNIISPLNPNSILE